MKLVYVCSPVRGDVDENLKKANRYCEYVSGCGHIPIAPHLAWQGFLPENPENREKALMMGLKLIEYCSEVWVCGDEISQGMQGEIDVAEKIKKPVMYVLQERVDENLKIRQTLEPLGENDCVPDSRKMNYENRILVMNPEVLIANARHAQNSLWIAYNGFGCSPTARGVAVYAKNLFDGRESQWERADFFGIVKPESLQRWMDDMPISNITARTYANETEQCQSDDEHEP
jgi:Txe/YoeB family toxin of Txe-Axe toxin-antitoxin module